MIDHVVVAWQTEIWGVVTVLVKQVNTRYCVCREKQDSKCATHQCQSINQELKRASWHIWLHNPVVCCFTLQRSNYPQLDIYELVTTCCYSNCFDAAIFSKRLAESLLIDADTALPLSNTTSRSTLAALSHIQPSMWMCGFADMAAAIHCSRDF